MTEIAPNTMKVSMHSYLPNAPINLRLNFNFEKLLKRETPRNFNSKKLVQSETPSCMFLCVPLKWVSKSTFKFDF